jgi:hypothetical protein
MRKENIFSLHFIFSNKTIDFSFLCFHKMKPRAKLPKSGGGKATKPANKGKPKAKAQPPVQAREDATTSEEAATTSTEVTAPVEDTPDEGPDALAKAEGEEEEEEESNDTESAAEGEKGADGAQTRARMLQRHKQELRVGPPSPTATKCPTGLHVLTAIVACRVVSCVVLRVVCRVVRAEWGAV